MSMTALGLAWEGHERESRDKWEQTRIIAYNSALPYLKDDPTMEQFMPLEWDSEVKETKQSDDKVSGRERFNELTSILNLN